MDNNSLARYYKKKQKRLPEKTGERYQNLSNKKDTKQLYGPKR